MPEKGVGLRYVVPLVIGVFMGAVDLTVLAPALPRIGDSFGVTPAAVVLAFSIYAAFYAVSVPLMGKLADVRGYKPVYGWSMALFSAGSAAAALAPSLPVLVFARVVQGIGGGGLFPVAQAIVGVTLPKRQQGKVLGILLGTFAAGGVLGPNLGGLLVQHLNWQWIFWINVPLGLTGILLLLPLEMPGGKKGARIDWAGALLVAVTFGSLVLGIEGLREISETGMISTRSYGLFSVTVAGLLLLVPVERSKKDPILDFKFITSPEVMPLLLVSLLVGFALLSGAVFAPTYVQVMFQASIFGSGAVLNAAAIGLGLSSWVAGHYTARTGGRVLVIAGMASAAVGLGIMILLSVSIWGILFGLVFLGVGLGLSQGPLSYMGLGLASKQDQGQISGLISITRSMGGATGITLAGVMLGRASQYIGRGEARDALAEMESQVWGSSSSLLALRDAPAAVQEAVRQSLGSGIIHGWYWAFGAAILGFFVSFALKEPREEPHEKPA